MRKQRGGFGGPGMGGGRGGGRGGGMGGPGGGRGGGMGGPGGGMGRDKGSMRERMEAQMEAIKVLKITHGEPVLSIRDACDVERTIYTDGRKSKHGTGEGKVVETSAKWKKNNRLAVKTKGGRGGTRTEIYELTPEGHRLLVTVKTDGGGRMPGFEFLRVYDRASEEEVTAADEPESQPAEVE